MKNNRWGTALAVSWALLATTVARADLPKITASPTNLTVVAGSSLILTVTAEGATSTYQWQKDGQILQNATNATLSITTSKLADTGVYVAFVSNGGETTNSDAATVSVLNNVVWSDDFSSNPTASDWVADQYVNQGGFSWQAVSHTFTISNNTGNDSRMHRKLTGLLPNHNYLLHAWVKGNQITGGGTGANICQWNQNIFNSASVNAGTFDWTRLDLVVTSDSGGTVEFACRLGYFGSTVTGTAVFGNLALEEWLTLSTVAYATVRAAYVIPSNRSPQSNGVSSMQKLLSLWQSWYRDQMGRYGFNGKTFEFETESDGTTPRIYVVNVFETDAALRGTDGFDEFNKVSAAARKAGLQVGGAKQVWLLVPETHLLLPDSSVVGGIYLGAGGGSGDAGGTAIVDSTALARFAPSMLTNDVLFDGSIWPEIGPYPLRKATTFPWFEGESFSSIGSAAQGGALHELSHAFGLSHDYRNDSNFNGNLMFNGCRGLRGNLYPARYPSDYVRLSYAAALALNSSRYFNHATNYSDNSQPELIPAAPSLLAPTDGLAHIDFTARDDTALAFALLYFDSSQEVVDEMVLSGVSTNATFTTPYFHPGQDNVFGIAVYDTSGNRSYRRFTISIGPTANQAPQLYIKVSPASVAVNEAIVLDASQTTVPNGNGNLQVQWDLNGDGVFDTPLATTLSITNSYSSPGMRLVRARAVDARGAASTSTLLDVRIFQPPIFEGYAPFKTALNTRASVAITKILNRVDYPKGCPTRIAGVSALSAHGGSVTLDSESVNYNPPTGYTGADTFTVTISDCLGNSIEGTLTVNVVDPATGNDGNGSNLASVAAGPGGITLTFYGIPGQSYVIQRSSNLSAWLAIATVTATPTGKIEYTDSAPLSSGYYRTASQ